MNLLGFHRLNCDLEQNIVSPRGQVGVRDIHRHRFVDTKLRLIDNIRKNKFLSRRHDGK